MPSDRWLARHYGITPPEAWTPREDYAAAPPGWVWWEAREPEWYAASHLRSGWTWIVLTLAVTLTAVGVVTGAVSRWSAVGGPIFPFCAGAMIVGSLIAFLAAIRLLRIPRILIREQHDLLAAAAADLDRQDYDRLHG